MKVIHKRLGRLETQSDLLRERGIAPGRAASGAAERNAEAEGRTYEEEPWEDLRGLSFVQVLQRGRLAHR